MRISDWSSDVCSSDLDAPAFVVEMTTSPQCAPCADLWAKLQILRRQYGVNVAVLSREKAIVRSGRLGLPWVGHPEDRKRVVSGTRVSVRVDLDGLRILKIKLYNTTY